MTAQAADLRLDPRRLTWTSVEVEASKLGISTRSEIRIDRLPRHLAKLELLHPTGREALPLASRESIRITVVSDLLGLHSETRSWLDAFDAQILQWTTVDSGRRQRYKASRFLPGGAWVLRKNPADKHEEKLPLEEWTRVREAVEVFAGSPDGSPVTDSTGLFYVLATADLRQPEDRMELFFASKKKVYGVEVRVVESAPLETEFALFDGDSKTKIDGERGALLLSLTPFAEGLDTDDFEVLGLHGDVRLWLDAERRFPLQVEGKIDYVGKVRVRLRRAHLVPARQDARPSAPAPKATDQNVSRLRTSH